MRLEDLMSNRLVATRLLKCAFVLCGTLVLVPEQSLAKGPTKLVSDASYLTFKAYNNNPGGKWKYALDVNFRVFGPVADGDAVNFQVFKGRRKLTEFRCLGHFSNTSTNDYTHIRTPSRGCRSQTVLNATGTLTVKMRYLKSVDGSKRELAVYKILIGTVKRRKNGVRYQVMPADAMGVAWIWLTPNEKDVMAGRSRLYFVAPVAKPYPHGDTAFQCKKDGQPAFNIPRVGWYAYDKSGSYSETRNGSKDMKWAKIWVKISDVGWGNWPQKGFTTPKHLWTPGKYECAFRVAGKVVRTFRFAYAADHSIVAHPLAASGKVTMGPQRHLIEIGFPKSNDYEWVFPRAAISKTVFYGQRWPASLAKSVRSLPRARGSLKAP